MTSRAITPNEARSHFLNNIRDIAVYWAEIPGKTPLERCNGLAFSILNIIDGMTCDELPGMDLVLRPHEDARAEAEAEERNWYEDGQAINADVYLHDEYYKP